MTGEPEPAGQPVEDSAQPSVPLSWQVFRAREHPTKTILAGAFILLILVIVAVSYKNAVMVLFAFLVFALTLNGYFLPVNYTFDENGITTDKIGFRYTRRWSEFRSFFRTTGGIVVSPFLAWSFLDNFRGIHLLLPRDTQPIVDYLRQRLPEKKRQ
jgi:hypothetical protein